MFVLAAALLSLTSVPTPSAVRIVPAMRDSRPIGFKVSSLGPNTIWHHLGLVDGDIIKTINGLDITAPDKGLTIYSTIINSPRVEVRFERAGKELTLFTSMPHDLQLLDQLRRIAFADPHDRALL